MATLTFAFLDAGQGDCTLIQYPDNSLVMVDCGSIKNSSVVSGEVTTVLNRVLPAAGNKISNLVLTHADQDHYNMLKDVIITPGVTVDQVYYGCDINLYKNQNESNATYDWLSAHSNASAPPNTFGGAKVNAALSRAGVTCYVLAANASGSPKAKDSHNRNTNSVVLLFIYNDNKVFMMGDASEETEDFIITSCKTNKISSRLTNANLTVLKMGHHGSQTSSSEAWIKALTPDYVVVSSDTRQFGSNGKGMPTRSLLDNVLTWSSISDLPKDFCHPYVLYEDDSSSSNYRKFLAVGPSRQAICTTLYEIQYDHTGVNFEATGGSWYYYLNSSGNPSVTVGWTGPKTTC
ncbi:MAG TPA: hypothetical protein VK191_12880 [Symbiobacteriaceae bacterium]|nr:hypothetical protein [Symbiobacteriaceae bacterium]